MTYILDPIDCCLSVVWSGVSAQQNEWGHAAPVSMTTRFFAYQAGRTSNFGMPQRSSGQPMRPSVIFCYLFSVHSIQAYRVPQGEVRRFPDVETMKRVLWCQTSLQAVLEHELHGQYLVVLVAVCLASTLVL